MNWSAVYDILRDACEAQEEWRDDFCFQMERGCTEYRFQGALGFGGKCRNNSNGLYVDCWRGGRIVLSVKAYCFASAPRSRPASMRKG